MVMFHIFLHPFESLSIQACRSLQPPVSWLEVLLITRKFMLANYMATFH